MTRIPTRPLGDEEDAVGWSTMPRRSSRFVPSHEKTSMSSNDTLAPVARSDAGQRGLKPTAIVGAIDEHAANHGGKGHPRCALFQNSP